METFKNQALTFVFLISIPYVCSPESVLFITFFLVTVMQTNRLKQTLRPQTGESPAASFFTVTGKVVVRGDGCIFSNNPNNLLLCVQSRTTHKQKRTISKLLTNGFVQKQFNNCKPMLLRRFAGQKISTLWNAPNVRI